MKLDGFVLLTDVRSVTDIAPVTQHLEDRCAPSFLSEGQEMCVRWSLGFSVCPDEAQELDVLQGYADASSPGLSMNVAGKLPCPCNKPNQGNRIGRGTSCTCHQRP